MMEGGCENELGMQCNEHPHRNNPAGAICAFCLQHKLHNLLSSSSPLPILPSSSPSPPSLSSTPPPPPSSSKHPFLLPNKNKPSTNPSSSAPPPHTIFKRSKSTATPRRNHLMNNYDDYTPRKRNGFWSFLYLSSSSSSKPPASSKKPKENDKCLKSSSIGKKNEVVVEDDDSGDCYLERKVSRSRSVGCGSRSFSGDFFERISNGLGDCTLRRVESQRGPNRPKLNNCTKERVRCAASSSSTTASSSSYSSYSSADDHRRGRSWAWAFASPIRAFSAKSTSSKNNQKNATPDLSAIPSLLTVS